MSQLTTAQKKITRTLIRHEDVIARELIETYQAAVKDVRGLLAELYERYSINGQLTLAEMTRYNRYLGMEKQIVELMRPHVHANNVLLNKLSSVQYEEQFYRTAWSFDNELRTSLRWGQIPTDQVRAAVAHPLLELSQRDLGTATINRVRKAIAGGLVRGASMPSMMKDIRTVMGTTTFDAMRIARTEAHRVRELGHIAAAERSEEMGVKLKRVWDAQLDLATRPSHAALDGVKADVGENFPGGPIAPGQWGIAGEDINCRCTVTDEIEDYEPETRRIRGEGVQPYKTFETWASEHGITGNKYGQKYNFVKG